MKIRCTTNHLRFRLRKSDVDQLAQQQRLRETIYIAPGHHLAFELAIVSVEAIEASFREGLLRVALPAATARQWIETSQVGIEGRYTPKGGEALDILIEKDFPCKHQPKEEKADTFQELAKKTK